MMNNTAFEINGKTYETNEKGNRFFVSYGQIYRKRIGQSTYEQAWEEYLQSKEDQASVDEWQNQADAELEARKELKETKDRETEDNFNKKNQPKVKKAAKPRRSKDVAFEMDTLAGHITLTAKQVDFLKHLPQTNFWEDGLESILWCDCIADEIGWNPMSVGAMISTLREKGLVDVRRDDTRQGKPKAMTFTTVGQAVAAKMGLK